MAKILHLIGNFDEDSGGAQRVILDIINTCGSADLQMGVCSLFGPATLAKHLPDHVFNENLNHTFKQNPKIFIELYQLISKWGPDVLHIHSSVAGIFGRPLAKIFGIKLVCTVHNDVKKGPVRNKLIDKSTLGFSDAIVCVSDLVKQSVLDKYGAVVSEKNIYTIRNCLDCCKLRDRVQVDIPQKKRELGIAEKSFILGTVGSLRAAKGYEYLIKAWARISVNYPEAVLLFAGDGKEEQKLRRLTDNLGISSSVFFLGSRNDVPEILNLLDVFVFPSIYEGLGIALLEAMCMEKVVIASDIEPLNGVVGDRGILVPPKNPDLLAEQIIEVLGNYETKKVLGKRAGKRIEKEFSPEEFGRKYLSVYREHI